MAHSWNTSLDHLEEPRMTLSGDDILAQISPQLRGDISRHERPSDVRLILRTAPTGQTYSFANFGHPDNERSTVTFNGDDAIMIMPAGETARSQLFSAFQIVSRMKAKGVDRTGVTPEFMQSEIVNPKGLAHRFTAQAYGPAPFTTQADRLVPVDIPGQNGQSETISPTKEAGYALGMRAPVKEEAFLVIHMDEAENVFVKGGKTAGAYLNKIHDNLHAGLKGSTTTLESLDNISRVIKGIVLSVDAATGGTKPIRLETAKDIFNLANLSWIFVGKNGQVTDQRLKIQPHTVVAVQPPKLG
jgi:hypothetical protein